jgi:hypothetical protein
MKEKKKRSAGQVEKSEMPAAATPSNLASSR